MVYSYNSCVPGNESESPLKYLRIIWSNSGCIKQQTYKVDRPFHVLERGSSESSEPDYPDVLIYKQILTY
jgi:hypothetical protein